MNFASPAAGKDKFALIGIPTLGESDRPNYVTVSTAEIQKYLKGAGRNTAIDALRLTTHSRGHRGLEQTMGGAAGGKAGCSLKASVLNPR